MSVVIRAHWARTRITIASKLEVKHVGSGSDFPVQGSGNVAQDVTAHVKRKS